MSYSAGAIVVLSVAVIVLAGVLFRTRSARNTHEYWHRHYQDWIRRLQNGSLDELMEFYKISRDPTRRPSYLGTLQPGQSAVFHVRTPASSGRGEDV